MSRASRTLKAGATAKISPARAQDWISSVLNPLIDGLKVEARYLPEGPWFWKRSATGFAGFEHFQLCRFHVHALYEDNFDDFLSKHRQLQKPIKEHDQGFLRLGAAVYATYRRIISDAVFTMQGPSELPTAAVVDDPRELLQDIAIFVAAGVKELGSRYSIAGVYNSAVSVRGLAEQASREERRERDEAAKDLGKSVSALQQQLVDERTRIADTYGARIRPVEWLGDPSHEE